MDIQGEKSTWYQRDSTLPFKWYHKKTKLPYQGYLDCQVWSLRMGEQKMELFYDNWYAVWSSYAWSLYSQDTLSVINYPCIYHLRSSNHPAWSIWSLYIQGNASNNHPTNQFFSFQYKSHSIEPCWSYVLETKSIMLIQCTWTKSNHIQLNHANSMYLKPMQTTLPPFLRSITRDTDCLGLKVKIR